MKHAFRALMAALVVTMGAASAQAQGASCGFGSILVPDGSVESGFIGAGASDHFWSFYGAANRTYVVELIQQGEPFSDFDVTMALCAPNGGVLPAGWTLTDRTGTEPKMNSSNNDGNSKRLVLKTPSQFGNGFITFQLTNASAAGRSYEMRISDATMFSASWSTNGTYDTYFSFYNNTNSTISATILLTTTAGAAGGTTVLSIPPGRTTPTNTVALASPRNTTGTALLFHDGPVGSIQAESGIANFTFTPPYIQYVTFKQRDYLR